VIDEERFAGVAREQNILLGSVMLIFGTAGVKNPLARDIVGYSKFLIKKVLPPLGI